MRQRERRGGAQHAPLLPHHPTLPHVQKKPLAAPQVVAIDRAARKVTARDGGTGQEAQYEYDALVLAPGAAAIRPTLPGIDLPGIFAMKTIPDV